MIVGGMTCTQSQMNIYFPLNSLPKDILHSIASFLNIHTLVIINKRFNEFKYSLTAIPYSSTILFSDDNKSRTKKILQCICLDELYKFKQLKSLSFDDSFTNRGRQIKKGDLPEGLRYLSFGKDFNNGGSPFLKGDLPEGLVYLSFGRNFTNGGQPIKKGDLPEGLQSLLFGTRDPISHRYCFDSSLSNLNRIMFESCSNWNPHMFCFDSSHSN